MQGKRTDRVGQLILMELSQLILHRVKDPRVGFVTVTHVDVSADLKNARVFVSVMGDAKKKNDTMKALEKASGFLQREIGHAIETKFTPKLKFYMDDSLDKDGEIGKVLKEIEKKDERNSDRR